MKGKLRYFLIAVAVLILLLLAVPFFVNVNQFRPQVEEKFSAALGRQVKVGNLSLSIFSGSLAADDLSIADDPSFSKSPFLSAKSLKVGVELTPLIFSKALHVTHLVIEKPEVTLLRDPAGKWNFSSLGASASGQPAPASKTGTTPEFSIQKLELKAGRVTVGSTASQKRSVYDNVELQASDLSATKQFPIKVSVDLPDGGGLKVEGKVGPLDPSDAALTPLDAKLAITGLNLARTGFIDPSSGIAGIMDMTSTLVSVNGTAKITGSAKLDKLQMAKGGSPAGTPINVDVDKSYDLRRNVGTLNQGVVKIGSAVAHLSGTFDNRGDTILLNVKLDGQNMPVTDLESVLPALGVVLPKGSSLQQGTMNANLNSSGPIDKLVTTGSVGLFNAKLAGFDLGSKLGALGPLAGAKSSGTDTVIQKLTSNVRIAPEGIRLDALQMVAPAIGQVSGNGTVSPERALNFKMQALLTANSGVAGAVSGLTRVAGNRPIPFLIQGTASDPKFVPDVAGLAGSVVPSQLGNVVNQGTKGLGGALGGLLKKK